MFGGGSAKPAAPGSTPARHIATRACFGHAKALAVATKAALRSSLDRLPGKLTDSGWKIALQRPRQQAPIHPRYLGPRLRADRVVDLRPADGFGGGSFRPPGWTANGRSSRKQARRIRAIGANPLS